MMATVELLQTHGFVLYILVTLVGLVVGSFLTVVIVRYPSQLTQQWRAECCEFLGLPETEKQKPISIFRPRSHCPACKAPVRAYHNIPVIGYLLLRGKCASCKQGVGLFYPVVELLTMMLSILVVWRYGLSWQMLAALLFTWSLIVLTFIDLQHQLLPDVITLSMLWIGLMINSFSLFATLNDVLWSSVIGYSALWLLAWVFLKLRNKQGMGHGDFKMLAMIGAWVGFYSMVNTLLLAIFISVLSSIFLLLYKKSSWNRAMPFGPFLAAGAWVSLLWGSFVIDLLQVSAGG